MNKLLKYKYWWVAAIAIFTTIIYLSNNLLYRIDLTAEKRFTVSNATKAMLKTIDSTVTIKLFLTGDLPADYRKLASATQDLLSEFRDISHNQVKVELEVPGEGLPDSARTPIYDTLFKMGVVFEQAQNTTEDNKTTNQLIIPSALVYYKNHKPIAVDLRSSRKIFKNYNVVNEQPQEDKEATLNAAEALLEFKFADAIDKLSRENVPTIAYLVGNGEPTDLSVNDLGENLRNDYRLAVFDLKAGYPSAAQIDVLLVVKPTQQFTDEDKLKIDQYVMNGGKVIWFIDKLFAEMDSLRRSQSDFVAFDRNLNLDDILFKYGARINNDLVQDLNCAKIQLVVGQNPNGSPVMQRMPFAYYPFLSAVNNNPIAKNLDRVLPQFPSSIDTVKAPGVQKTILLASDTNSRSVSSPAMVSLNSVKDDADFQTFNKSFVPVAVLLEGNFTSLFANRLTKEIKDSVARASHQAFLPASTKAGKQIVVSNAGIVTNQVSRTSGPLPMGEMIDENYRFANREFFLNSIDYMVNTNGLFALRNRDFTLRLLDKQKVAEGKTTWQFINIALPILVIILFGLIYQWNRKRKFAL